MSQKKYTKDHEWVILEGKTAAVGISDYAKKALGDLVFLEIPEAGTAVSKGDDFAVVESVKAASEIYSPVSGEITKSHAELADNLDDLGGDESKGWIVKIEINNESELEDLMDEDAYKTFLEGL